MNSAVSAPHVVGVRSKKTSYLPERLEITPSNMVQDLNKPKHGICCSGSRDKKKKNTERGIHMNGFTHGQNNKSPAKPGTWYYQDLQFVTEF